MSILAILTSANSIIPLLISNYAVKKKTFSPMSAIFLKKIIYLFFFYWIISVFILIIYQAFFVQYFDYNYDFIIIFLIIQSFATIILSIIYGFCISIGKYRKGAITNSSSPLFKFIFILIIFYLISKSTEILILSSFFATLVSIVVGALFLKNYNTYFNIIAKKYLNCIIS